MFRSRAFAAALAVIVLLFSGAVPALAQQQSAPNQASPTTAQPEFNVPTMLPPVEVNQERQSGARAIASGPRGGQGGVSSAGAGQGQEGSGGGGEPDASAGITAGRDARIVERTTNVTVISAKQIEDAGARTLDQALRLAPGVYVRDGGGDGIPRIDIRGFRTRNILLLIDGIPYNSSFDGQFDPRMIPTNNIARIKITEGASSVLYGPFGNAAVIDIITKSAGPGVHGSAEAEAAPERPGVRTLTTASYGGDAIRAFLSTSTLDQDRWQLSNDFKPTKLQPTLDRVNSDRTDRAAYGNMQYDPGPATQIGFSVSYTTGDYGKPPSTVSQQDSIFAKRTRFERVDDSEGWNLQASVRQKLGDDLTFRPIFFFNQLWQLTNGYDDATFSTQKLANSFSQNALTTIYGTGQQLSWRWGEGQVLTVSANAQNDSWQATGFNVVKSGKNNVASPEDVDHSIQTYWFAAEQELRFTRQWTGVAGINYAENVRPNVDNGNYTYLVGTRYELTGETAFRGSVARKIRFPTLGDLYDISHGNPNLKPEITQNYEVALEQNLPNQSVFLTLALFRTEATNFIETDVNGVSQNIDRYNFQGVETRARYTGIRNLTANFGYTYLDAINESAGATTQTLQARPRHRVTAAFDYLFSTGTKLHADYLFSAASADLSRTTPTVPIALADYHLINVGVSQQITKNAELFVRVDNVLDQNYVDNFGFEQAGRTFFFGARAKF